MSSWPLVHVDAARFNPEFGERQSLRRSGPVRPWSSGRSRCGQVSRVEALGFYCRGYRTSEAYDIELTRHASSRLRKGKGVVNGQPVGRLDNTFSLDEQIVLR